MRRFEQRLAYLAYLKKGRQQVALPRQWPSLPTLPTFFPILVCVRTRACAHVKHINLVGKVGKVGKRLIRRGFPLAYLLPTLLTS